MLAAPRGRNALVAVVMASLGVLRAPQARALESQPRQNEGEESAARRAYDVPSDCPEHSVWLRGVRARLPPLLQTHPLLATLSVRIQKISGEGGDAHLGELVSTSGSELSGARHVRGASCGEVLDALAFIGALGLERAAAHQRETQSLAAPAAGEGDPLERARLDGQPLGAEASANTGTNPAPPRGVQLAAVGFGLLHNGLAPGQSVALGAAVRAAWSVAGWQPLVSLGAYVSLPEERRLEGGGRVRYEHWSLHAVACPRRFPAAGLWGIRPCAELDVGRSSGEGSGIDAAERHSAPWLSTGAQLRAELSLWDRLELSLSVAAVAPLYRAHFFLYPGVERFDTPALGFRAGGFAAVLF